MQALTTVTSFDIVGFLGFSVSNVSGALILLTLADGVSLSYSPLSICSLLLRLDDHSPCTSVPRGLLVSNKEVLFPSDA